MQTHIPPRSPDRRSLLRLGAGAALLAPLPRIWTPRPGPGKTRRVILVAFAGGVRTRETLGTPGNVPNLMRMAREGVVFPRVRTENLGHFGAAMTLFTGISEARGIRDNARGGDPTVFEYVRKELGWPADQVWISTSGGAQQANYSYSLHPDYGEAYGANTLDGDGVFNAEFRSIVDAYGKPKELSPREAELLARMRAALLAGREEDSQEDAASFARVESFLFDELRNGTADLRGAGAADAKALRVARNLMAVFRPGLLGVVLQRADVAHGSYNAYVEVIRRNDAMLGELFDAVRKDPELADSTAIFVVPEFGRDKDLNVRRGLDHGDGSDDLRRVAMVAWGPDFRRGAEVLEDVRSIDLCPTVCELLGARARHSRGRRLRQLFA
ncbi:MAG TPA: hypothetical protein ENJ09_11975 [Planctomycetes bacterium]|nr:hypothetical protein [Planctomycetota bacterium]